MKNSNWSIRDAEEQDLAFIYATWTNAMRYYSNIRPIRNSIFFSEYTRVIDWILDQSDTEVAIACDPQEEKVIFGYLVQQANTIHFAYTKEAFWKFGIAKSLYNHFGGAKLASNITEIGEKILRNHQDIYYNPFVLFKQGVKNDG